MNKNQIKGRVVETQGKVKEVVGKAVGNTKLQVKGAIQKNIGAAQAALGDAKEDIAKKAKKDAGTKR
ncbi:CsbD family protein [Paludibacterium yongneupense]|uniref:CsbD family protein n=1 Tax=Paludibacterium yongneupense TaxID=400061 RepID=UPI0004269383|nr:CsbD family protein [Paludibacterium yongneupense]